MADYEYQLKRLVFKYSKEYIISSESKLKCELVLGDNNNKKEFEELETYCFDSSENKIMLKWDNDNQKEEMLKDIEHFCKREDFSLLNIRKSIWKYLLYKYGKTDKFIWEFLKKAFIENYFFIFTIEELINKDVKNSSIRETCYDLVYEIFTDGNFQCVNIPKNIEPFQEKLCNSIELLMKFINILIGSFENRTLIPNERIKSKNEKVNQIFQICAMQFKKMQNIDKYNFIIKELYLFSIENDVPFIKFFIDLKNPTWNSIKKAYTEHYEQNEEVINDLYAFHEILKKDYKTVLFLRYPLWLVIKLIYSQTKTVNNCYKYFETISNQLNRKQSDKEKTKKMRSLLYSVDILEEHLDLNLYKYFYYESKKKDLKFLLLHNNNKHLDTLIAKTDILKRSEKKNAFELKTLLAKLIEEEVEKSMKDLVKNANDNKELTTLIENKVEDVFSSIVHSLKNKSVFKYGKDILNELENDIYKNKTFSLKNEDCSLPQLLMNNLKIGKDLPSFFSKKMTPDIIIETLKLKEHFLGENDFMIDTLKQIINQNVNINDSNSYLDLHMIEFKLLHNIHSLISKLNLQINNLNENQLQNQNVIVQKFSSLVNNISIPFTTTYETFHNLITDIKELAQRTKYMNSHILDLQLYELILEYVDDKEKELLLQKAECTSHTFINYFRKENCSTVLKSNEFNELKKIIKSGYNVNKFIIEVLRIYYLKTQTQNVNNVSLKDIISYLCMKVELSFEGISLYQQIFGDIINLQFHYDDNDKFLTATNIDSFSEILNITISNFEVFLNFFTMKSSQEKVLQKVTNVQFMLIQSVERYFLKIFSYRNVRIFGEKIITKCIENSIQKVTDLNNSLKSSDQKQSTDHIQLFQQFIAIAILKIYFAIYEETFIKGKDNKSYFFWVCDYFLEKQTCEINKVFQFYIGKLIRNKHCSSFFEFKNFNFSQNDMIWFSNLKFKSKYEMAYEYLFFSEWENSSSQDNTSFDYFTRYQDFVNSIFIPLKNETFRTSKYNSDIKHVIEDGNVEMWIDVIMNLILHNAWNREYFNQMESVEFCSWSKYLISNLDKSKIDDKLIKVLKLLTISRIEHEDYKFHNLLNSIYEYKQVKSDENLKITDIEIAFIAIRFAIVFIINNNSFLQCDTIDESDHSLINMLYLFIVNSLEYYSSFSNCEIILNLYKEIEKFLRIKNINQIKLFMNFLYCRIKYKKKIDSQKELKSVIQKAIEDWPNQKSFIKKYYEHVQYKEEKIRNFLLDEKIIPEILIVNKSATNQSNEKNNEELNIPVYLYFYYEIFPSWDHFIEQYSDVISKQKYPFISFFNKEENYDLFRKQLTSKDIRTILNVENKEYYNFKYAKFDSLDELVVFYSKSFVFAGNEPNATLGYLLEYDIEKIEKELSKVKEFSVEKTNVLK